MLQVRTNNGHTLPRSAGQVKNPLSLPSVQRYLIGSHRPVAQKRVNGGHALNGSTTTAAHLHQASNGKNYGSRYGYPRDGSEPLLTPDRVRDRSSKINRRDKIVRRETGPLGDSDGHSMYSRSDLRARAAPQGGAAD